MDPPTSSEIESDGLEEDSPPSDETRVARSHSLRRQILRYCTTVSDRVMQVEDLVDHLLGDRGRSNDVVKRESIEVKLHHHHLPKLADEDIIEFNPRSGQFRYQPDDSGGRDARGQELRSTQAPSPNGSTEAALERHGPRTFDARDAFDSDEGPMQQSPARLPLDTVYDLLSVTRRRRVLRYLCEETGSTNLGTLAEHIAAVECRKPVSALDSAERKRVYICLYQHHLPRMADAGVIDYDQDRGTIELAENADQLVRFLPDWNEPVSVDHTRVAIPLALLGGGLLIALHVLYPAPWLSGLVVGSLLALWYMVG